MEIKRNEKNTILGIHKYRPRYIFLAESSSTPAGYLMKEALRKAYPGQPLPVFYRIDPRQVINLLEHSQKIMRGEEKPTEEYITQKKELERFFKERIKDWDARILIYDADWSSGKSPGSVLDLLKNPQKFGFENEIRCKNVKMNLNWSLTKKVSYKPKKKGDLVLDINESDVVNIPPTPTIYGDVLTHKDKYEESRGLNHNFRARIRRGEEGHKYGLSYINQLKSFGRKIGKKIRQDLDKKQNLEHKVTSVIAIIGFLGSIALFSSNITGNTIADLSLKTSSSIGIVLFTIALVSGYFWLRNKRDK